jgi:hypothetical protein
MSSSGSRVVMDCIRTQVVSFSGADKPAREPEVLFSKENLLIFTLSMDEIAVSFFLIGRENTLPLESWSRLRRGITPEINAVSAIIFFFSLLMVLVWYRLRVGPKEAPQGVAEVIQGPFPEEAASSRPSD